MHKDKAGCMRLSAGGRKRGAAALVAGTRRESQGWGASSGVAGDGDSRGPEDRAADTPRRDSEGGVSPPAPRRSSQTRGPMARTVGTRRTSN